MQKVAFFRDFETFRYGCTKLTLDYIYFPKTIIVSGQTGFVPISPIPPPTDLPNGFRYPNDHNTATPDATMRAQFLKTVYPTPTDITISHIIDLSPNLKDADKFHITVRQANGTYLQYNVGPLWSRSDLTNGLPSYIVTQIPLKSGEKIGGWDPPVQYQRFAPGVLETLNSYNKPPVETTVETPTVLYSIPYP